MRLAQMPIYRVGQDPPAARHHSRRDQRGQDRAMARWHSYSQNARVTLCSSAVGRLTGRPNSPTVSTLILLANSPLRRPREAKMGYAALKALYPAGFRADLVGTLNEY